MQIMKIDNNTYNPNCTGTVDKSVIKYFNKAKANALKTAKSEAEVEVINKKVATILDDFKNIMEQNFRKDTTVKIAKYDDFSDALMFQNQFLEYNGHKPKHNGSFMAKNGNFNPLDCDWKRILLAYRKSMDAYLLQMFVGFLQFKGNLLHNISKGLQKAQQFADELYKSGKIDDKFYKECISQINEMMQSNF